MQNPESQSLPISPRQIYSYDRKTNIPWNLKQYQPRKNYQDPMMEVQKRKWAEQKKGVKDNMKYVTKRGFYMDYDLKVGKSIPSSVVHGKINQWAPESQRKKSQSKKIDQSLQKYTYLQRIEMEQQKRKVPGICTYKLEKSIKEIQAELAKQAQKKISIGQKRFFYQDTENMANSVPGVGNYNPHNEIKKVKQNKSDYKFWIGKHKKMDQTFGERQKKKPAAGTYSPRHQSYRTFDEVSISPKKQQKNGFGSDARFPYIRPNKKKIVQKRPDPISYNTTINWKGKSQSPKQRSWNEAVWKGSASSIYH